MLTVKSKRSIVTLDHSRKIPFKIEGSTEQWTHKDLMEETRQSPEFKVVEKGGYQRFSFTELRLPHQEWEPVEAEIVTTDAVEKLIQEIKVPSLLVRAVEYMPDFLHDLGLDKICEKAGEIDVLWA